MKFCITDVGCGLPLTERQTVAAALQRQLREHFAPAWDGLCGDATVRAATPDAPATSDEIDCRLMKTPTQDGALGYHDRTASGVPVIFVFPLLCRSFGDEWSSCLSHELVECAADPYLQKCVQLDDGSIIDYEVADRVQADSYKLDGIVVSNFNTPACFEPPKVRLGVAYDFLRLSTEPNQVRPGGYAQSYTPGKGWVQRGAMTPYRAFLAGLGLSRGARRAARTKPASFFARMLKRLGLK